MAATSAGQTMAFANNPRLTNVSGRRPVAAGCIHSLDTTLRNGGGKETSDARRNCDNATPQRLVGIAPPSVRLVPNSTPQRLVGTALPSVHPIPNVNSTPQRLVGIAPPSVHPIPNNTLQRSVTVAPPSVHPIPNSTPQRLVINGGSSNIPTEQPKSSGDAPSVSKPHKRPYTRKSTASSSSSQPSKVTKIIRINGREQSTKTERRRSDARQPCPSEGCKWSVIPRRFMQHCRRNHRKEEHLWEEWKQSFHQKGRKRGKLTQQTYFSRWLKETYGSYSYFI